MANRLWTKPYIISAEEAHDKGIVTYNSDGVAKLRLEKNEYIITKRNQFDLTQPTLFGLNQRLTSNATSPTLEDGNSLRFLFNKEWEEYTRAVLNGIGPRFNYGNYVFYPEREQLVRFCDEYWHRVVSVASNSNLLLDPAYKLDWAEVQTVFGNSVVGVAGCSVGSNIAHTIMMDTRPRNLKITDKSLFKMENVNRVRLGYQDLILSNADKNGIFDIALRNKAQVISEQIYSIDPYVDIYLYSEGISNSNIDDFFGGTNQEPPLDIIVEEVDDPRIKVALREKARDYKIPLVMVTDIGSLVQLDVLRYDKNPTTSLTFGTTDESLLSARDGFESNPSDRKLFYNFVDQLIGVDYQRDELGRITSGVSEVPTATLIPQLGSTVSVAAGIAGEVVARVLLGHDYPPRSYFDKKTMSSYTYN